MRPCKVCESPNRSIYEDLIKVGIPLRKIVEKAKEEFKEDFSHMALSRHSKNHMDHGLFSEVIGLNPSPVWKISVRHGRRHPIQEDEDNTIDGWHPILHSKKSED